MLLPGSIVKSQATRSGSTHLNFSPLLLVLQDPKQAFRGGWTTATSGPLHPNAGSNKDVTVVRSPVVQYGVILPQIVLTAGAACVFATKGSDRTDSYEDNRSSPVAVIPKWTARKQEAHLCAVYMNPHLSKEMPGSVSFQLVRQV